jgi:hypothetical protein
VVKISIIFSIISNSEEQQFLKIIYNKSEGTNINADVTMKALHIYPSSLAHIQDGLDNIFANFTECLEDLRTSDLVRVFFTF